MPWIRALHVISVIVWAGPLLLMTQMLAMHASEVEPGRDALGRVELRLFNSIINPAAAVVLVTGILQILGAPGIYMKAGWFHAKLALALALFALHFRVFRRMQLLVRDPVRVSAREFQVLHGASALLMILIVILVIVKP
jgi:putative membrane protein